MKTRSIPRSFAARPFLPAAYGQGFELRGITDIMGLRVDEIDFYRLWHCNSRLQLLNGDNPLFMSDTHSRIGEEIEAYCGRCRLDRIHRIVAQDPDGSVRKIICAMCNSYRNYRTPKENQTRTVKRESARSSSKPIED